MVNLVSSLKLYQNGEVPFFYCLKALDTEGIGIMKLTQLTKVLYKEQFNKFSKTGIGGQKEKQLEKYSSSI